MKTLDVQTRDLVAELLLANNADINSWGNSCSESFDQQVCELLDGDSFIRMNGAGKVERVYGVVCVKVSVNIHDKAYSLYEHEQQLDNGGIRKRYTLGVAEKVKVGEAPIIAATRGLKEELFKNDKGAQIV